VADGVEAMDGWTGWKDLVALGTMGDQAMRLRPALAGSRLAHARRRSTHYVRQLRRVAAADG